MFPLLQKIYSRQIFPTKNAKSELSRCIRYSSYSTPCMLENLPSKYIWCSDCSDLRSFPWFSRHAWSAPEIRATPLSPRAAKPRYPTEASNATCCTMPNHPRSKMEDSQLQKKMSTKKGELPPPGDIKYQVISSSSPTCSTWISHRLFSFPQLV